MSAGLWGLLAALAFGGADFCGRLSGRLIGPRDAMISVLLVGGLVLSAILPLLGGPPHLTPSGLGWALAAGIAASLAPLALYKGMTYGPLSLVGPVCGAYPVLVVPVTIALGARPEPLHWAAMAITVLGVILVARHAAPDPDALLAADDSNRRRALLYGLGAAFLFAAALLLGQRAAEGLGAVPSLWLGRWTGLALLLAAALATSRRLPVPPRRLWGLLVVQGLLDAGGFLAFILGSHGPDAPAAAVASSGFMVVAVLLGRLLLNERVSVPCWLGIALVCGGVSILSAGAA